MTVKFEWPVYVQYQIEEERSPAPGLGLLGEARAGPRLIGQGVPTIRRSLEAFPELYLKFAELDPTPGNCLSFARRFGLLTNPQWEHLSVWQALQSSMKQLIGLVKDRSMWADDHEKYVPRVFERSFDLQFEPDVNSENLLVCVVPRSLNSALRLQCLAHSAAGGAVRACAACGNLMRIGGVAGGRADKRFCNNTCRTTYFRRAK
jgi:hypothetical protein